MKQFDREINHTFKPIRKIQVIATLIFVAEMLIRYVLLMEIQRTVDSLTAGNIGITQSYIRNCLILVFSFFFLNCFFQYWYRKLQYTSHYSLMKRLFGLSMRKEYSFYERFSSSSILTMVKDDSKFISDWQSVGIITVVFNVCCLILAFGVMLYYSVLISIIVFLIVMACFLGTQYISRIISDRTYQLQVSNTEISTDIVECLDGIKDIKQYKKEGFFDKKLSDFIDEYPFRYSRSISRYYSAFTSTYAMLVIAMPILTVIIGVGLVMKGQLSIGQLIAIYGVAGTLQESIQVIPDYLNKRTQALAMQEKIAPILKKQEREYQTCQLEPLKEFSFSSRSFTFPDGKSILHDVDFTLLRGEAGIVSGPSGRGKTSLLNLISRFYDTEGQPVSMGFNGIRAAGIEPEAYYSHVLQSQQTPYIFRDTILNNITLGEAFSEREIHEAVEAACLEEFVESKGMDYLIEQNGENISGGQKQRLGLARALIRKPELLMLDEPVSALNPELADTVTERVAEYCRRWRMSLLIVSHNDSFEKYYEEKQNGKVKKIFV